MASADYFELRLTPEQIELLLEILQAEDRKLAVEIRHTDKKDFRSQLSERQRAVGEICSKLETIREHA